MKRSIFVVMLSMFATVGIWAQSGKSCYSSIPIGKDFTAEIKQYPQTVWYSAWTFDLPLTIYFMPENGKKEGEEPEVEMDFTCTKGVYGDSILCSLFCKGGSSGLELDMPHKPALSEGEIDGKFVYYFTAGKKYRDLLLQLGISYNLQVFVKVTFHSKGTVSMAPDNTFANCMDGHKFMRLGDSITVKKNDKENHIIVPYVQWQEDSIRYIWEGEKSCYVTVAGVCDYDPTDQGDDPRILDIRYLKAGRDTAKVTSAELRNYVRFADNQAGMFFAKCYANSAGKLKIERVPMAPPRGDATVLKYGKQVLLNAHDTASLFAMPIAWKKDSVKFTTPTHHIFRMFVNREPKFVLNAADFSRQFFPSVSGHWCGLYSSDVERLWERTSDQYMYVRFDCSEATTVTPNRWDMSDCAVGSYLITPDTVLNVNSKSTVIYRFYYPSITGGDLSFLFSQTQKCLLLFSDTCKIAEYPGGPGVKYDHTIRNRNTFTMTAEMVEEYLAPLADADGYIYVRFYTEVGGGGNLTITSTVPKEKDPVYPLQTVAVVCEGNQVQVISREAQQLTIMDLFGSVKDTWPAEIGVPHVVTLPSGYYELSYTNSEGKSEKIALML